MLIISIIGYLIIALYVLHDVRAVIKRCRPELRQCFGRKSIYLRERKTGRLIACSNNPFTLLLVV